MKTISLRRFNREVEALTEPVTLTISRGGEYRILGTFYPKATIDKPEEYITSPTYDDAAAPDSTEELLD